jgi:hypothetical protein
MGASSAESADNSGPLEKRVVSKNWSVRANAFDELTALYKNSEPNSKSEQFRAHVDMWKVYLKDNNPGALEKILTCLEAFLDKADKNIIPTDSKNGILGMLIEKGLGHMKPIIKSKT